MFFGSSVNSRTKTQILLKYLFLAQELAKPFFSLTGLCACAPIVNLKAQYLYAVNKENGEKFDYKASHSQLRINMFSFYIASKYTFLSRQRKA